MWHPAHVDGRSLVVLRPRASILGGHDVVESGLLANYGDELRLVSDGTERVISEAELAQLQPVTPQNRIAACRSFDFFLMLGSPRG